MQEGLAAIEVDVRKHMLSPMGRGWFGRPKCPRSCSTATLSWTRVASCKLTRSIEWPQDKAFGRARPVETEPAEYRWQSDLAAEVAAAPPSIRVLETVRAGDVRAGQGKGAV